MRAIHPEIRLWSIRHPEHFGLARNERFLKIDVWTMAFQYEDAALTLHALP